MYYFDIYKLIIQTIANEQPNDTEELVSSISDSKVFHDISDSLGEEAATNFILDVFENMNDDRLIKARQIPIDGVILYEISRLTTEGFLYLETLKKPTTFEKIKEHAIEEGLAPTPQNITKLLAKLSWE